MASRNNFFIAYSHFDIITHFFFLSHSVVHTYIDFLYISLTSRVMYVLVYGFVLNVTIFDGNRFANIFNTFELFADLFLLLVSPPPLPWTNQPTDHTKQVPPSSNGFYSCSPSNETFNKTQCEAENDEVKHFFIGFNYSFFVFAIVSQFNFLYIWQLNEGNVLFSLLHWNYLHFEALNAVPFILLQMHIWD